MSSKFIKPPALNKGDTIALFASSNRTCLSPLDEMKSYLESQGFSVIVSPLATAVWGPSAGKPQDKAEALHDLYKNDDVKAIFCIRGGYRAGSILEYLDFDLIKSNPKIILGYSDVTVLINAINQKTGVIGFHGPMSNDFANVPTPDYIAQCFSLLSGSPSMPPLDDVQILKTGYAEAPLIGGNLSLLISMIGTPWEPDWDGKILFLEDVGDNISRYDRMVGHLRNAGVLDKISGLVLGNFTRVQDTGDIRFDMTVEDSLMLYLDKDIPIISNAPFGHDGRLYTLPVGTKVSLDASSTKPTLKLLEPAVQTH